MQPNNWIHRDQIEQFLQKNNLQFQDYSLLQQAFIHRSYLNEHKSCPFDHNERLEFLGDAVLELVVTEYLYKNYPNPEGELTNWRSALVKGEVLAEYAKKIGLPDYLLLSKGEDKSGGRLKGYLLANAFEAFLGALYLDQGYTACQVFITRLVSVQLQIVLQNELFIDPKSRLQEYTQAQFGITPIYSVVAEAGPDHEKIFDVVAYLKEEQIGFGQGSSKQAAQVAAALNALEKYKQL